MKDRMMNGGIIGMARAINSGYQIVIERIGENTLTWDINRNKNWDEHNTKSLEEAKAVAKDLITRFQENENQYR